MPDYYTHPNGYTVKRDDRGVRIAITSDAGYTSTWIDNPRADAIRAFFLAELGLWRDPETGALVVVESWSGAGAHVIRDGALRLGLAAFDPIIARWRATLTPPPREPQPGEVWRIDAGNWGERNALVLQASGGNMFDWGGPRPFPVADIPADRRRLLVEADGTVVSDE